jgi:3-hydroxyacyl-CoA dehydrogenase
MATDRVADDVDRVAVVGAGRMGHGIAVVYALAGREVTLTDADESVLAESEGRVRSVLGTFVRNGRISEAEADRAEGRISFEPSLADAVADADFVTEAVSEDLAVKRVVFEELDEHAPPDAILATNTSGLRISDIAESVEDPSRVVGTHWFNPPYIVPLVEVVRGEETADAAMDLADDLLTEAGKTAVRVEKDIPGFIGNRIQNAMAYEAFSLLARGVASAEDIDRAIKAGFGFRLPALGVFEKADHSGLEIHYEVEKELMPDLDRGTEPNPVVTELAEKGQTGLDAGEGVYDWSDLDPEDVYEGRDDVLLSLLDTYERQVRDTDRAFE